jgi:hypothetical protein
MHKANIILSVAAALSLVALSPPNSSLKRPKQPPKA